MMFSRILLLAISCCSLFSVIAAQAPPPPPRPVSPEQLKARTSAIEIFGEIREQEYINKFFGFTFVLPENFSVLNRAELEVFSKAGAEMVGGDEKSRSEQFAKGLEDTIVLFAATSSPAESTDIGAVEIVAVKQPDNATARLALAASVKLMTGTGKYTVTESLKPRRIGGREFVGVEYETMAFGPLMRQQTYATMRNGYSLFISLVYLTPDGHSTLETALKGLKFDPAK